MDALTQGNYCQNCWTAVELQQVRLIWGKSSRYTTPLPNGQQAQQTEALLELQARVMRSNPIQLYIIKSHQSLGDWFFSRLDGLAELYRYNVLYSVSSHNKYLPIKRIYTYLIQRTKKLITFFSSIYLSSSQFHYR